MPRHPLYATLWLGACGVPADESDARPPAQLEAIGTRVTVDGVPWGLDSTSRRERLTIEGADQEYVIRTRDLEVRLHSPGHNDITSLTDRTGSLNVAPTLSADWPRSLVITSDTGWAYVANVGFDDVVVDAAFTMHVADFGAELSTFTDDRWRTTYFEMVVHTDDGDITLVPGESIYVTIHQEIWRVTSIAAYVREPLDGVELPDCPTEDEILSYEMLKVPEVGEGLEFRRPRGTVAAALDCEG